MISFRCDHCGRNLKVKDELAGKKGKCPGCGKALTIPQPALSAAPSANLAIDQTLPPRPSAAEEVRTPPIDSLSPSVHESVSGSQEATSDFQNEGSSASAPAGPELCNFLAPAQQADEIGRLGPYRVLKVLGAGGMGVVFRAEDPGLQRLIALKAILPSYAGSSLAKERFLREARAAAALKHQNIVTIYQVDEDRGAPFLAMEFLEGESLDDRLKRQKQLPVSAVCRIGRAIAAGLEAAHERNLIHRDIKPANIWLEGPKEHVKILDFGLARAMGDQAHLTQSGAIIGTPAYMAPEQAGGKPVDHRCDLFSLGCVLYRMATGELPFKGNDTISILSALALQDPEPPASLNVELPADLSDLIMQLLAKKPKDRPESAREVEETLLDIENQVAGKITRSLPRPRKSRGRDTDLIESAPTQFQRLAGKQRLLLWLSGGVASLALAAVGLFFLLRSGNSPGPENNQANSNEPPPLPAAEVGCFRTGIKPNRVTISDDCRWALASEEKNTIIHLLDLEQSKKVLQLDHGSGIAGLAISKDGKQALSGGLDAKVNWWDLEKPSAPRQVLVGHKSWVRAVTFHPDGRHALSTGNDGMVIFWDLAQGEAKEKFAYHQGVVGSLRVSHDGRYVVTSSFDTTVGLLNLFEKEEPRLLQGHTGPVAIAVFSKDGDFVLSGGDTTARFWRFSNGEEFKRPLTHPGGLTAAALSDDSRLALTTTGGNLYLWDVRKGKEVFLYEGHDDQILSIAFHPDGQRVVSGARDGTVRFWRLPPEWVKK